MTSDTPLFDLLDVGAGKRNRNRHFHDGKPTRFPTQREKVKAWLAGVADATREEISDAMQLPLASVCGRISELIKSGDVIETKNRRETKNGKFAVVVKAILERGE